MTSTLAGTTGVELSWLLIAPVQMLLNGFVHVRTTGGPGGELGGGIVRLNATV